MKVALLSYHANVFKIYPPTWIEKYRHSISEQTLQNFTVIELDYSGKGERVFDNSQFSSVVYPTFVHGLNAMLDTAFKEGYDVVFNSNVDDYYSPIWLESLIEDIKKGFDLVSSNFCLVRDEKIFKYHIFNHLNLKHEIEKGHNIVAHPAVCYTKNFWENNRYIPEEIPFEDLKLWQRALKNGTNFYINSENLLFHRIHNQSVCHSQNR